VSVWMGLPETFPDDYPSATRVADLLGGLALAGKEWMTRASCREFDPDEWFPEVGGNARAAKRICADCPVRVECLEYALEGFEWGVWGGLSTQERRRLKARRAA